MTDERAEESDEYKIIMKISDNIVALRSYLQYMMSKRISRYEFSEVLDILVDEKNTRLINIFLDFIVPNDYYTEYEGYLIGKDRYNVHILDMYHGNNYMLDLLLDNENIMSNSNEDIHKFITYENYKTYLKHISNIINKKAINIINTFVTLEPQCLFLINESNNNIIIRECIELYTFGPSIKLNNRLLNNLPLYNYIDVDMNNYWDTEEDEEETYEFIKRGLDMIFKQIPKLENDIIVYRNIHLKDKLKHGAYISTTISKYIAENIDTTGLSDENEVILKIRIPKGHSVIPMYVFSKYLFENEVLLNKTEILNCNILNKKYYKCNVFGTRKSLKKKNKLRKSLKKKKNKLIIS